MSSEEYDDEQKSGLGCDERNVSCRRKNGMKTCNWSISF